MELPFEIWEHIASYLTLDNVKSLACTCKFLKPLPSSTYFFRFCLDLNKGLSHDIDISIYGKTYPINITITEIDFILDIVLTNIPFPIHTVKAYNFIEMAWSRLIGKGKDGYMIIGSFVFENHVVLALHLSRYASSPEEQLCIKERMNLYRKNQLLGWFNRNQKLTV